MLSFHPHQPSQNFVQGKQIHMQVVAYRSMNYTLKGLAFEQNNFWLFGNFRDKQ
jgi:hypothetical protein